MGSKTIEIAEDKYIKLSYGALSGLIMLIVGAIAWATTIQISVAHHGTAIENVQVDTESLKEIVVRIDKNVVELNTIMNQKFKQEK